MANEPTMLALNETKKTVLASRLRREPSVDASRTLDIRPGDGIWLEDCRRIDTSAIAFSLELVFLDEQRRVVAIVPDLRKGMRCPEVNEAASVLRVAVGTAVLTRTQKGDRILIEPIVG